MDEDSTPKPDGAGRASRRHKVIKSRGLRFPNDPQIIDAKRRRLLDKGEYEVKEFTAIMAHVRPADVVIELGAGMGFMSTAVAVKRHVAALHAFEANPALIPYIRSVHRENGAGNVTLHNAVLGREAGVARFYVRRDFTASSLDPEPADQVTATVEIEQRPIDAVFREIRPSFLICDIEGAEASLLPMADLSSLRGAVVELHPQRIGEAGVRAVFDAMTAAGLTYYPKTSDHKVVTFLKGWA